MKTTKVSSAYDKKCYAAPVLGLEQEPTKWIRYAFKENENIKFEMQASGELLISVKAMEPHEMPEMLTPDMQTWLFEQLPNEADFVIEALYKTIISEVTKATMSKLMWTAFQNEE